MIVGQQEGLQVLVELRGGLVVEALDGGLLDGPIHALDLAVGPGVGRFGQAVLHAVFAANAVETVPARQELVGLGRELDPVVGQHGMHFVRQLVEHPPQKFGRDDTFGPGVQFGKRHLAGAVDGHKKVLLAFFGLDLGEIDVQVTDGIVLEFLFRRALPVFVQRQSADAVPLKTAVQGRARQVRNRGLQRVQAVVERQQRVLPKSDGHRLLLDGEHGRGRHRPHRGVRCGRAFAPFGNRFRIDAVAGG